MHNNKPIIKTIDIETAPIESYTWGLFDQNISVEQIKTEWSILSYAIKTLGDPKVRYKDTGGRGVKKVRDDKALLLEIHRELDETDIVIAQNGRAFDTKKINARMIMHGIRPYSPVRVIDTLEVAKKHFRFTSNKLQWMSKHLTDQPKDDHKEFPGFELWIEVLKDNPKAWAAMKKYNCQDVLSAEEVYIEMRPWIAQHPNLGVFSANGATRCPKCGSDHVQKRGYEVTQASRYQRFQCMDCSGWSRGKALLTPANERKALLVAV